jgi:Protein of unknown function (DUF3455)
MTMLNKLVFSIGLFTLCYRLALADTAMSDVIKVPAGNKSLLTVHAKGDQIYLCGLDAGVYTWKWQAPDAELFDSQTQTLVGSHGAGPSWKYRDGSSAKAKVIQKADAPDKANVPWLLLEVTGHKGDGLMGQVSYIQRINTQGGVSPTSGCDTNHLGSGKRVPYGAEYVFYGKQ